MNIAKLKRIFLSTLFLTLPFNSSAVFADELLNNKKDAILIAETKGYREHEDRNKNENDYHSINHDWENHYHVIKSIRLRKNGNLTIRFCEKVELLEGQISAQDIKYDVKDANKITKRSITWRLNKKGSFDKGDTVFVNTKDFLGRPIEKSPNTNEIRSLNRGCALPFLYLPPGVEVSDGGSPLALIGVVVAIGAALGGGSSGGTGGTSHN